MKLFFTTLSIILLFLVSTFTLSFAQTDWTKYAGNPVLRPGPSGEWDDYSLYPHGVLFDGTTYHMWYGGHDGTNVRIGYATSDDGISWTKYDDENTTEPPYSESDPVLVGEAGEWDDELTLHSSVLYMDGKYHMWYAGGKKGDLQIGYATSLDGITWERYDENPVMKVGPPESWEYPMLRHPDVYFDGNIYHMWYSGNTDDVHYKIGYATSYDGIAWTKYDDANTTKPPYSESDPVLNVGEAGAWDDMSVAAARVVFDSVQARFKMWYGGIDTDGKSCVGYAEDFSHIAHSDSLSLNFSYASPGSDTLRVKGRIKNPDNNTLELKVHIVSDDSMVVDSTELIQEQDELWGAEWPVPETEKTYRVAIKTRDLDSGTMHDGMLSNFERFTTIGPVVFEGYRITNAQLGILKLKLKNAGQEATAKDITVELTSTDPNVISIITPNKNPVDIPAGQTVETNQTFTVQTEGSPDTLYFDVKIFSNGYHFWTDSSVTTFIKPMDQSIPKSFSLAQNYPNPFNPSTKIKFDLPKPETIIIEVYNIIGQKIQTLLNKSMPAGYHEVEFNGRNLSSGVYLYRIDAGGLQNVKKMILLQ